MDDRRMNGRGSSCSIANKLRLAIVACDQAMIQLMLVGQLELAAVSVQWQMIVIQCTRYCEDNMTIQ